MAERKVCKVCGKDKPAGQYYKDGNHGLRPECKVCYNLRRKVNRLKKESEELNKEWVREA